MSSVLNFLKTPLGVALVTILAGAVGWLVLEVYNTIKTKNQMVSALELEIRDRVSKMKDLKPCNYRNWFTGNPDRIEMIRDEITELEKIGNDFVNEEFDGASIPILLNRLHEIQESKKEMVHETSLNLREISTGYNTALNHFIRYQRGGPATLIGRAESALNDANNSIRAIELTWLQDRAGHEPRKQCSVL